MFTCICRAVTDNQIRAAIVLGASTVDAVARETRASTGCGGCRGKIQDMIDGRAILVRFVITQVSEKEAHFEQAYSADGGSSWEVNWVAVDTKR